jgi:L-ascorbate metabolism protein UlaG (beta-lactamase superfamily)
VTVRAPRRLRRFVISLCSGLLLTACLPRRIVPNAGDPERWGLDIVWHGHSCFSFRDGSGRLVVIDPFDETVGYQSLRLWADVLLITHDHFDHNNVKSVSAVDRSSMTVVNSTGTVQARKLTITGVLADHDDKEGRAFGRTCLFIWTMGGLRIAHLGDLGQRSLTPSQKEALRSVDVLLIPVGGFVTLDAPGALKIAQEIAPRVVIPMHYGRPEARFYPLDPVDPFVKLFGSDRVRRFQGSRLHLVKEDLPSKMTLYVPETPISTNIP